MQITMHDAQPLEPGPFIPGSRYSYSTGHRLVLQRDGPVCQYCDLTPQENKVTADHIVPQALGGCHHSDNLAVACYRCNQSKGALTLMEWRDAIVGIDMTQRSPAERFYFTRILQNLETRWKPVAEKPVEELLRCLPIAILAAGVDRCPAR